VTPSASDLAPTIVFLVLVVVLIGRRVYLSVRGTSINPASLLGFAGFFVVLFALTVVGGFYLYPSYWLAGLAADAAALVAAVWLGIRYTRRRVEIWRRPDGVWMYRTGVFIVAVYLTLFAVRLLLDLLVVGVNPLAPMASTPTLSPVASVSLLAVDALFAVSTGLFLGRNIGVYLVYRAALRREPPPGVAPVPPAN
jgi:hypothetical protein